MAMYKTLSVYIEIGNFKTEFLPDLRHVDQSCYTYVFEDEVFIILNDSDAKISLKLEPKQLPVSIYTQGKYVMMTSEYTSVFTVIPNIHLLEREAMVSAAFMEIYSMNGCECDCKIVETKERVYQSNQETVYHL